MEEIKLSARQYIRTPNIILKTYKKLTQRGEVVIEVEKGGKRFRRIWETNQGQKQSDYWQVLIEGTLSQWGDLIISDGDYQHLLKRCWAKRKVFLKDDILWRAINKGEVRIPKGEPMLVRHVNQDGTLSVKTLRTLKVVGGYIENLAIEDVTLAPTATQTKLKLYPIAV